MGDPDDLDGDNEADFLTATKHKIDNYLAKQYLMGRRKLTVSVNYANMPLEYQYLSQFHGFPNPVAGTPLGQKFGLTTQRNTYKCLDRWLAKWDKCLDKCLDRWLAKWVKCMDRWVN